MQLRVDLSTMSRNVTLLERSGYLVRARDAEDARIVHVRLTAKGKRALDTLCCDERDVLRNVYDKVPVGERPKLVEALELLRSCLKASDAEGSACCPPASLRKGAS
jgi:DNA-binding MarR family transcriptional regulator